MGGVVLTKEGLSLMFESNQQVCFWKAKVLWTSVKTIFDISDSFNVIQAAAVSMY